MFNIPQELIDAVTSIKSNLEKQVEQGTVMNAKVHDLTTSISTLTSTIIQLSQILIELDTNEKPRNWDRKV